MKIAAGIEYRGSGFVGWQKQKHGKTVQTCVEQALSRVANTEIQVHCAGRTDTGVHAVQQVIHFETSVEREMHSWVFGANANAPEDINLLWAIPVDENFHARFSAISRKYVYVILNRVTRPALLDKLVTWECRSLDIKPMLTAAAYLLGEHDFTSYRALDCQSRSPVREIRRLDIRRHDDFIIIEIVANAFLHHMVRNIAGVLMAIGMGMEGPDWAKFVLDSRDRTVAGITAPANGLYLVNVEYPQHYRIPEPKNCFFAEETRVLVTQ